MRGMTCIAVLNTMDRESTVNRQLVAPLLAAALLSCGANGTPAPTKDPYVGAFIASGGGGGVAPTTALVKRFDELHPNVKWQVNETNSDAGVKLTATGQIDVGFITRQLTPDEAKTVQTISMGVSGTAIIVNAVNKVSGLTKSQLQAIYSGSVTDWSAVGGTAGPIRLFMREQGAATRSNFESYVFGGKPTYAPSLVEIYETTGMLGSVGSFAGAIGIATVDAKTEGVHTVRMLAIDGITPNAETLAEGSYKIARPLFLVFPADATKINPTVKAFLDFVRSPEGQAIIASAV